MSSTAALPSRLRGYAIWALGMAAIYAACWLVTAGALGRIDPGLALGAAIVDLTLTSALFSWWALVRRGLARARSLLALVAINLLFARALLPAEGAGPALNLLVVLAAAAELLVAGLALGRLRQVVAGWRRARAQGDPPHRALSVALSAALPAPLAHAVATELALLGLAIGGWLRRTPPPVPGRSFSLHRRNQWFPLVGVLLFLVAVESLALHAVLAPWSTAAAIAHAVLAVYGALWILGDAHALRLYPLRIEGGVLQISVGLRWSAAVPLASLRAVRRLAGGEPRADWTDLGLPGGEGVLLETVRPVVLTGPFGVERRATAIRLTVDAPEALVAALQAAGEGS